MSEVKIELAQDVPAEESRFLVAMKPFEMDRLSLGYQGARSAIANVSQASTLNPKRSNRIGRLPIEPASS